MYIYDEENQLKILAVADIHGNINMIRHLAEWTKRESFDLIIVPGDIGVSSKNEELQRASANEILSTLCKSNSRLLYVPGNWDFPDMGFSTKNCMNIDQRILSYGNLTFVGFGGSNFTPAYSPYEWKESKAIEDLSSLFAKTNANTVLITHSPPFATALDETFSKLHIGSRAVRETIFKWNPALCICGHVHEAIGSLIVGKTVTINPGSLNVIFPNSFGKNHLDGLCAKIDFDFPKSASVEFIYLGPDLMSSFGVTHFNLGLHGEERCKK